MSPQMPIITNTPLWCSVNSSTQESPRQSNVSTLPTRPAVRKNTYPCPLAEAFSCSDRFTTSGHAARHARTHTGKKDAFCPECNRAFIRRDNMEQHRRTHQKVYRPTKAAIESNKIENLTKSSSRKSDKPLPPSIGVTALAQVKKQQQQSPRLAPQSADASLCKKSGTFYSHCLQPPSANECKHDRQHSELPMLPRFHPANFPTPQHGSAPTVSPGIDRNQARLGSQSRHKQVVEAQKRLKTYRCEVLDFDEGQGRKSLLKAEPSSPKLQPTTLSGPVTPLALEEHET